MEALHRARRQACRRSTSRSRARSSASRPSTRSAPASSTASPARSTAIVERAARRAGRGDARRSPPAGWPSASCRTCETIDEVDDLLTLTGLRLLHERNADAVAWTVRSLTDPWTLGGIRIPNRVVLAPLAGIGNWFVRLQAKRYGAGLAVSEMVSSFGVHHGNERTCARDAARPPRRAPGSVAMQLFGARPRRHALAPPRSVAARRRRPDRPQHGLPGARRSARPAPARRCSTTPTARWRVARAAREGSGLPVTVKLRSRRHARATARASSWPTGSSTRPASPRIGFHPRHAAQHHKGTPDYELARRARGRAAGAGDHLRRPARRRDGRATPSSTRAPRR